jgi:hypothetical protein
LAFEPAKHVADPAMLDPYQPHNVRAHT